MAISIQRKPLAQTVRATSLLSRWLPEKAQLDFMSGRYLALYWDDCDVYLIFDRYHTNIWWKWKMRQFSTIYLYGLRLLLHNENRAIPKATMKYIKEIKRFSANKKIFYRIHIYFQFTWYVVYLFYFKFLFLVLWKFSKKSWVVTYCFIMALTYCFLD